MNVLPKPAHPLDVWLGGKAPSELRRVGRLGRRLARELHHSRAVQGRAASPSRRAADAAGREIDPEHFGVMALYSPQGEIPDAFAQAIKSRNPDVEIDDLVARDRDRAARPVRALHQRRVLQAGARPARRAGQLGRRACRQRGRAPAPPEVTPVAAHSERGPGVRSPRSLLRARCGDPSTRWAQLRPRAAQHLVGTLPQDPDGVVLDVLGVVEGDLPTPRTSELGEDPAVHDGVGSALVGHPALHRDLVGKIGRPLSHRHRDDRRTHIGRELVERSRRSPRTPTRAPRRPTSPARCHRAAHPYGGGDAVRPRDASAPAGDRARSTRSVADRRPRSRARP